MQLDRKVLICYFAGGRKPPECVQHSLNLVGKIPLTMVHCLIADVSDNLIGSRGPDAECRVAIE
jgi:hypothetical protein